MYRREATALKNQIEGYGHEYVVPAHSLLDDLIEAKAKIVPDAFDGSARCFVDGLERLHGAVKQARDYVNDLDARDSLRWVSVVVVHDPLTGARSAFRLAALRWGFLEGSPLCAAAVLDTSDVEHLVLTQSADEVGEMLERLWLQASAAHPMSQPPSLDPYVESQALPLIQVGYEGLFGSVNAAAASVPLFCMTATKPA